MTSSLLTRSHAFERGDRIYLTTPLTLGTPSAEQVDEFAFASAVKSMAPNENLGWLQGRYVESDKGNRNNQMWLSDELAIKALTPMLMPVTVMHDPRTAVGTIADTKLIEGERARIETILAIWKHRFSDVWDEVAANIEDGSLMQSMECHAPWYSCDECGQTFVKLNGGAERASWCEHLRHNSSRRILGDVCFTGTGLIFGTRGGEGAYTEAHLDHFRDEIAEFHDKAHIDSTYRSSEGSAHNMGLVQIEQSELDTLRQERNDARTKVEEHASSNRELTGKLEQAEASVQTEKTRADAAEKKATDFEESAQRATLKDKRIGELGQGFLAKLGEFTRGRLTEAASTLSDGEWDAALKEKEEMAGVKRDAKAEGSDGSSSTEESGAASTNGSGDSGGSAFSDDELARFSAQGVGTVGQSAGVPGAARQLARAFSPKPKPQETAAK